MPITWCAGGAKGAAGPSRCAKKRGAGRVLPAANRSSRFHRSTRARLLTTTATPCSGHGSRRQQYVPCHSTWRPAAARSLRPPFPLSHFLLGTVAAPGQHRGRALVGQPRCRLLAGNLLCQPGLLGGGQPQGQRQGGGSSTAASLRAPAGVYQTLKTRPFPGVLRSVGFGRQGGCQLSSSQARWTGRHCLPGSVVGIFHGILVRPGGARAARQRWARVAIAAVSLDLPHKHANAQTCAPLTIVGRTRCWRFGSRNINATIP